MKYNGPKVRLSRQLGVALTMKSGRYLERRPYPPGQHGPRHSSARSNTSSFKIQLLEKQRIRCQYNISERQMHNYFVAASRGTANTADRLVQLLESRLDAVVHRGGLARTIYAARQYVRHGHVLVNGRLVDIPSYAVNPGDVVAIREDSRKIPSIILAVEAAPAPPTYLHADREAMQVRLNYLPRREEVPVIGDLSQVIEFYSR